MKMGMPEVLRYLYRSAFIRGFHFGRLPALPPRRLAFDTIASDGVSGECRCRRAA